VAQAIVVSSSYGHRKDPIALQSPRDSASPTPPVRTPADLAEWDPDAELGYPGQFPSLAASSPPCIAVGCGRCGYAGFATAEESNARYRYLLAQGVSGGASLSTCRPRWATT
jgi:methylmalonyl-CoA mutase N-terminal domain/subunit